MDRLSGLAKELQQQGVPCRPNEEMKKHTTFAIGGPAALFCAPKTQQQFVLAYNLVRGSGVQMFLLGKGSNLLFCDEGYPGVVLSTQGLQEIQLDTDRICAGAGVPLQSLCRVAQRASLTGLEFAYGIPGSVGGAVFMNAGAYGGCIEDTLRRVWYLDEEGQLQQAAAAELELGYRHSVFHAKPWCIVRAEFELERGNATKIEALMQNNMSSRKEKQPLELPSAGSAFKRPKGAFAGALIDQCGLRGFRVGGAAISEKHCGFIVNLGGATCDDVLQLAEEVAAVVKKKTGFVLEKEVRVVCPAEERQA